MKVGQLVKRFVNIPSISYVGMEGSKIIRIGPKNVRVECTVRFSPTGSWYTITHLIPKEHILEVINIGDIK